MTTSTNIKFSCVHCQSITFSPIFDDQNNGFCCYGCQTVYSILSSHKLLKYYDLEKLSGTKPKTIDQTSNNFTYLDQVEFLEKYSLKTKKGRILSFYLEGIHCVACLWLIEKLPELMPNVLSSKLNMSNSITHIQIDKVGKFSDVAILLAKLGYTPHPIMQNAVQNDFAKKDERNYLIKTGVAFACAGNIMLMAIAVYAGAGGIFAKYFEWYSLLFSLPVIFFSTIPFYQSSYYALKRKELNLDVPITAAILAAFSISLYNMSIGSHEVYFDSLSTLVFLMLFARFVLRKAQHQALGTKEVSSFFLGQTAHLIDLERNTHEILTQFLNKNDRILIKAGEVIPADGRIVQGQSSINNALLTGESKPLKIKFDDFVYAGSTNLSSDIEIIVSESGKNTKLGQIITEIELNSNSKPSIMRFADKFGKYFILIVSLLSLITLFFVWPLYGPQEAISRVLCLIIVTCPCVVGLATPFAMTMGLNNLAKKGIVIKNESVIEKIANIKSIVLDKTGTLTFGEFKVIQVFPLQSITNIDLKVIYSMENKSKHPIAKAICEYIKKHFEENQNELREVAIDAFEEVYGRGVNGSYENNYYEIKALKNNDIENWVQVIKNKQLILKIKLSDKIRPETQNILSLIKNICDDISMLSGDSDSVVKNIGDKLSIKKNNLFSEKNPNQKKQIISTKVRPMMIGDGANDALAMQKAYVGVAVKGAMEVSMQIADAFITRPGIRPIYELIVISNETMKIIKRNIIFSIFYNIIGALLSIFGLINPLIAAVLMPLSSLSSFVSTIIASKSMRNIMK